MESRVLFSVARCRRHELRKLACLVRGARTQTPNTQTLPKPEPGAKAQQTGISFDSGSRRSWLYQPVKEARCLKSGGSRSSAAVDFWDYSVGFPQLCVFYVAVAYNTSSRCLGQRLAQSPVKDSIRKVFVGLEFSKDRSPEVVRSSFPSSTSSCPRALACLGFRAVDEQIRGVA